MDFPRHVYKLGTAKPVVGGGVGEFTAESRVVRSKEEFDALGETWVGSPALVVEVTPPAAPVAIDDRETKPTPKPKKVK